LCRAARGSAVLCYAGRGVSAWGVANPILPQEGDHVSVWFSGDVEVSRGWYDGKVSQKLKTRSRVRIAGGALCH
jgi:hypothetical protein